MNKKLFYKKSENKIKWHMYEFAYQEKDKQWFLVFWIVSIGVFTSLLIFKNIFGAATMALFVVVLYMYAIKEPEIIECELNKEGVNFNDRLFSYEGIASFWVLYEPPVKELILISKHKVMPKVTIPLGDANPIEIRDMLLAKGLIEKEEEESLSEIIARKLRF